MVVTTSAKATLDVLVVGNEDLTTSIKQVFDDQGVVGCVDRVSGYLMALGHLTTVAPKVLIGRIETLGHDAPAVGQALRRLAPHTRMILLSPADREREAAAALDHGFDDYLIEPVSQSDLLRTVEKSVQHDLAEVDDHEPERQPIPRRPYSPTAEADFDPHDPDSLVAPDSPESGALFNGHHPVEDFASEMTPMQPPLRKQPPTDAPDLDPQFLTDTLQDTPHRNPPVNSSGKTPKKTAGAPTGEPPDIHSKPNDQSAFGSPRGLGHPGAGLPGTLPGALPGAGVEGMELVEHLLAEGRQIRQLGLKVITQRTGLDGLKWSTDRSEIGPDRTAVDANYKGRAWGFLHADRSVPAQQLAPWAGWLARWLALEETIGQLWNMALRDDLTGAWNQRYFNRFITRILDRALKERFFVTVVLFDIEDFRAFNKLHGRPAGDEALRDTVKMFKSLLRPHDAVARLGGDEFALVLWDAGPPRRPNSRHPDHVTPLAQRFQQAVDDGRFLTRAHNVQGDVASVGGGLVFNAGLASFPWNGRTGAELLTYARQMLEHHRRQGAPALEVSHTKQEERGATSAA